MRHCPYCQHEISSQDENCPHCGRNLGGGNSGGTFEDFSHGASYESPACEDTSSDCCDCSDCSDCGCSD